MKTKILAALLLGATALSAAPRFSFGFGFGVPVRSYYAPPPVYVAPAPPVYAPAYVAPAPVYGPAYAAPYPGYTWVGGYWYGYGLHRVWRPGYWAAPRGRYGYRR
jgi:hypothetical protein